ncbi:hypothetical protein [Paraburkholderia sp. C35]|uniref:hypothetical protein n=1 Tax=Paraburkholderia sp. C35 TaxID=2126993 RepID=UPI000D689C1B|nr:hypothetical protein [Paraburkholderia sp. C35]
MPCCPLTRTLLHLQTQPGDARASESLYRFATALATRLGWYRLERLLSAIPDSNDDFSIF